MRELDWREPDFDARLGQLLAGCDELDAELTLAVQSILREVRMRGDAALVEYTNKFDQRNVTAADLEVPRPRLKEAAASLAQDLRAALEQAAARIRDFHLRQNAGSWAYDDGTGVRLGQRVTALDRIGVYVPGGRAAYPSSVLMNAVPARVAGVGEIIMTAPAPRGELHPAVLAAAHIAGVDRVFSVGGAQAIAAMAWGTATIPAVDKIVGPGNRYVTAAKRLVFGSVGIDMVAGPSEVVVVYDGSSDPAWVAMDLFAQAEHDEDARAILICTGTEHAARVRAEMERLLPDLERRDIIRAALERNGASIIVADRLAAAAAVNRIAPEHLELAVAEPEQLLGLVRHAGAVFLGCHAAEVLGDYCAGPNHVLPTARSARFSSALGVQDFQKRTSVTQCTAAAAAQLGRIASVLARAEGLTAHARAAEYRAERH
ncbi:MAG: histidinol dehydrogenase [Gammaproteobacteria bacterium]|nr:histidinol dehydrogenase [Gammaproteobacteria bacterium]